LQNLLPVTAIARLGFAYGERKLNAIGIGMELSDTSLYS
jgi:hypothetical protein